MATILILPVELHFFGILYLQTQLFTTGDVCLGYKIQ
jgi:hypothetical protein